MNKLELGRHPMAGNTHNMRKHLDSGDNLDADPHSLAHFHAVATRSIPFRERSFEEEFAGQIVDSTQSARTPLQRGGANGPTTQPANAVRGGSPDQSRPKHEPGEQAVVSEHVNSQPASPCTQNDKTSRPDKHLKKLRAAEARRRHELLEEERELQDNLAEFWDSRFDKPRRRRAGMTPLDAHTRDTPSPEK